METQQLCWTMWPQPGATAHWIRAEYLIQDVPGMFSPCLFRMGTQRSPVTLICQKFPIMVTLTLCVHFCYFHQSVCQRLDESDIPIRSSSLKKMIWISQKRNHETNKRERERPLVRPTVCACECCLRFPYQRQRRDQMISNPRVTDPCNMG